ncbi:hypothetical protein [Roseobacter sp. S98]|uniref:hypothetical protein n=1 Tax=Roseobacter algicola (ex Choi et al. 2025) (nom. illeg.) TaxID=3092138 RepID=UPI003F5195CF
MVARGKFFLYDSIVPALEAGSYTLTSEVDLQASDGADLPVDPLETHFNVTAPRLKLPPDQALMTFPPANSEGAYEARLPQIVLKKRTLPWDRRAAPVDSEFKGQTVRDNTPWLALVLIAEGEGQIVHDADPADCVTPGTTLSGSMDVPKASYLSVPQSTVDAVFPTVDDLTLLTHVREVNLDDTEAAMGDDDGFLAVVISNRMPQFDTEECLPKAYTACLINLEEQLDVLPAPSPPRLFFEMSDLFINQTVATFASSVRSGAAVPLKVRPERRALDPGDSNAMNEAIRRGEVVFHDGNLVDRGGATRDGINIVGGIDPADLLESDFSTLANAGPARDDVFVVEGAFTSFRFPLDFFVEEKFYRFPVLTSWRFTCSGAGSFQQLLSGLDVGMLGTKTDGNFERQLPKCHVPPTGDDPGASPVTRLPLEIAETGHIGLPYLTRTGEDTGAWYRGPFSPHQLLRNPLADEAQFPVLAHVSDHLRMMTPDGREDVSLAVAFETGRLLALSQPSFVAALQRWRAEQFGRARARANQRAVFDDQISLLDQLADTGRLGRVKDAIELGAVSRFLESELVSVLGTRKEAAISNATPLVNPGARINELQQDFNGILAGGLGLDRNLTDMIAAEPVNPDLRNQLQRTQPATVDRVEIDLNNQIQTAIDTTLETGLLDIAEIAVGKKEFDLDAVRELREFESLEGFIKDRIPRR